MQNDKKRRYFSPYDHMAFISVKEASHHVTFIWWLTILTNYQKVRFFLDRRHAMSTCRLENLWPKTEEIFFFSIIDVLFHGHIKTVVDIVDKMSKNMPCFFVMPRRRLDSCWQCWQSSTSLSSSVLSSHSVCHSFLHIGRWVELE